MINAPSRVHHAVRIPQLETQEEFCPSSIADGLSIEYVESLTQIEDSEWDRLGGRNVLASYGWLRTLVETRRRPLPNRYILARTSTGIVGAAVCEIHERGAGSDLDGLLFGRFAPAAKSLRLSALPSLVCGTAVGIRDPILVQDGLRAGDREQVTAYLFQAVDEMAQRNGWTVCFRGVKREKSPILAILAQRGYLRSPEFPIACLELGVGWQSFADFRQHLRKTHRETAKNIRREINLGKRAGVEIEQLDDPGSYRERLHFLMDSHYLRLNGKPFPFGAEFFEQLTSRLPNRTAIYVARMGQDLIGVLVGLRNDDAVFFPMIGMDTNSGRAGAAYFNLGYNRPIADSIAAGHRRIYFGKLAYDLKARRGCGRIETDLYIRPRNRSHELALRAWFPLRSRRIDSLSAALPRTSPEAA